MLNLAGVFDADGNPVRDPARGLKTVQQGAATSVWCATSPQLNGMGGLYCEDCEVASIVHPDGHNEFKTDDVARTTGVLPYSIDAEAARRLWKLSVQLVTF